MKRRKKYLIKPAGSHPKKTKIGMPPERSGDAVSAQPETGRQAGGFPVVGIGASAGGLAAFEAFFSGMPHGSHPGMAFVLVQHLAPDNKSILTDLIRRYTPMQVFEVEDGMEIQINCTYIIPPNRDMAFLNGALQLLEPVAPRGRRMPIDFFFQSLAQDQRERAIGVMLSGTGSDGTLGVRAIKGEGGMVMAQNPETTEYDGMPRSAIATGLVDYELPPAEMPAQLIAYTAHAFGKSPLSATPPPKIESALKKIFVLLRAQTGHDFSQYKPTTSQRRIERRMAVHQIETMVGYVKFIQQTPEEVEALFRDMMIGVTNFFRDPEVFRALEEQIIPRLFADKGADDTIRIWVPGCSTGEEAYSLAILLAERQEALKKCAGPAGFWLIRGGAYDGAVTGPVGSQVAAVLPGPAPVAGQGVLDLNTPGNQVRDSIREIPIAIQDRSFNEDGSLFYPSNRAFFEGLNMAGAGPPELQIPFVPDSDIAPIWNPEAFFNVMVVNGTSWPTMEVAPALYRFRLLNGCNSRFLNLSLSSKHNKIGKNKAAKVSGSLPFFQIGGDQGFFSQVVKINVGEATPLAGNGKNPKLVKINKDQALLLGPAERADVIVDFRGLPMGTVIRMFNTAPDAPFGGFPDIPADPSTTGQVMQFVVNSDLNGASPTDPAGSTPATDPYSLTMNAEPANTVKPIFTRTLSLNEEESATLCVTVDALGNIVELLGEVPPLCGGLGVPMAPKAALLGTFDPLSTIATPQQFADLITERPVVGDTEQWDIYNLTVDSHPIHLHLVRFQVVNRQLLDPVTLVPIGLPQPPVANEKGYKDTVIAYPATITRVKATFDIAGLYVWHCHIVEHEDNEMMRPYCVDAAVGANSCPNLP